VYICIVCQQECTDYVHIYVYFRSNKQTDVEKHPSTSQEAFTATERDRHIPTLNSAKTSANTAINMPALVQESVNNLITVVAP